MKRKTGLYVSEAIEQATAPRASQGSASSRLSTIAERYQAIIEAHKPSLSMPEIKLCAEALEGIWHRRQWSVSTVWADILERQDLGQKYKVNVTVLGERVRSWDLATKTSLVEWVESYWANK